MYKIMAVISMLIRQYYLPNPFECFGANAVVINWIAEAIIHILAFALVGMTYIRGSCPPLGSLLYLITYASIVGVLALMGIFSFAWWWVIIVVAGMILIGVLLGKLGRWLSGETW